MLAVDDCTIRTDPRKYADIISTSGKALRTLHDTKDNIQSKAKQKLLDSDPDVPARLDRELVGRIATESTDGGISWVYSTLTAEPAMMAPAGGCPRCRCRETGCSRPASRHRRRSTVACSTLEAKLAKSTAGLKTFIEMANFSQYWPRLVSSMSGCPRGHCVNAPWD